MSTIQFVPDEPNIEKLHSSGTPAGVYSTRKLSRIFSVNGNGLAKETKLEDGSDQETSLKREGDIKTRQVGLHDRGDIR
jgi:hypothetical protein